MVENSYISCIKINGVPIMPPLLTPNRRRECQEYREKAIAFERKLMRQKVFKQCMDSLQNLQPYTRRLSEPRTLEMQMTVDECKKIADNNNQEINLKRIPNLTRETVEVSEYVSSDGINNDSNTQETVLDVVKPKLVRSASYTLDSPSPILLAHLEKEARKCSDAVVEKSNHNSNDTSLEYSSISPETVISSSDVQSKDTPPKSSYIVETDIKVEQIKVTAPIEQHSPEKTNQIHSNKDTSIDPIMKDILATFPADSVPKIMELLDKQQNEQLQHSQNYEELKTSLSESEPKTNLSISSTQSLYYSITSDNNSTTRTPIPDIMITPDYNTINLRNTKNTKRRLIYHHEKNKEWAATIIQAVVRGYLVRRLIKTEKVQMLIETIKDALLCALQLHNTGVIDQSDIELHRRLLQQISAACYAFHDIFFVLSIKEQMSIIAIDRERLIEKAKRPLSSNSRRSSQPSPRQIIMKSTRI